MPSTSKAYCFRPNNQRKDSIVPFHGTGRSRPTWDAAVGSGSPGGGGWKNRQRTRIEYGASPVISIRPWWCAEW